MVLILVVVAAGGSKNGDNSELLLLLLLLAVAVLHTHFCRKKYFSLQVGGGDSGFGGVSGVVRVTAKPASSEKRKN